MNTKKPVWTLFVLSVALAVILAGCGTGPSPTEQPAATEAAEPGEDLAVASLEEVERATVLIEAQGTFIDPEFGMQVNAAGSGSGFIIDPSGIVVTNNHVVTGAALIRVHVPGEEKPRNARILGVSECSDLAVIDVDGEGFPFLEWRQDEAGVGLEVYTAGYPLGDPEFTMTKGIVSKAQADGETSWASIDAVLEHDATINPGNSGGPLVDAEGRVVGVNYASSLVARNQYFAIRADEALPIIDQLRDGQDVDSIGVNGVAVANEDGSPSGIWVSSVASGSPADQAGVQPGDIITSLEGLVLATDGTMADYCDVLRTHGADATLSLEVLRYATGEVLSGQLNGRALEATASFTNEIGGDVPSGVGYPAYTYVQDDYGALQVEIPADWAQVDGSPWVEEGKVFGASLWAAPDLQAFVNTWDTPGVLFDVTANVGDLGGASAYLDQLSADFQGACTLEGREAYDDGVYQGAADIFSNCGGTGTSYVLLVATPIEAPDAFLIELHVQIVSDADWEALDRILASFDVVGTLPNEFANAGGEAAAGYREVFDDYQSIRVEVPSDWGDVDGRPWVYEGEVIGGMISAAPDLEAFTTTWDTPGMVFGASDDLASLLGYVELLNAERAGFMDACELDGRYDYEDPLYRGKYDLFVKCGGPGGATFFQLAAVSKESQFDYLILVQVQLGQTDDAAILEQILNTFEVVGALP